MSLDLGTARNNYPITMNRWRYLFVGECTGNATIKLGSSSASGLDPNEFEKLTDIAEYRFLFVTNTAQSGFVLNIYYEEEKTVETEIKG
jgi:hypothetical protein